MSKRFVTVDRDTPMLLPPDLRDWVGEDDMVHFILEAVDRLPLERFRVNHRGSGDRQFPPHMMLGLLIYCYAHGIFSSRKIETATYRDVAVRFLTADTHPDHDTICKFRRENLHAFEAAFIDVLELATELKLLKLGNIALDGTHIKASASIDKNVTYERAVQLRKELQEEIGALLTHAETADQSDEDNQRLPEEIARREKLASKMDQAIEELKARAEKRQKNEKAKYNKKVKERKEKERRSGKKTKGREPKKPNVRPEDSSEQCNLTDKDARIMRKNKRSGFTQSYNAQAAVDADGSQLILGHHVSQSATDAHELIRGVTSIPENLGTPQTVSSDAGYMNTAAFEYIENELGIEVYCSVHREDAHSERQYDFRPENQSKRPKRKVKDPCLINMQEKLQSAEGKEIYSRRNHTVETTFGIIKEVMGFRGFMLRGIQKVTTEWNLVCLSYNIKRIWGMLANSG